MCPSGRGSESESVGGGQRKRAQIGLVERCFADRVSEDEGESSLFMFVMDPGISGRNRTYDIILGKWAEVLRSKMLEVCL